MKIKVTTYNIQSCKDYVTKVFNPETIAKVINEINPDILGLNEVRGEGIDEFFFDQVGTLSKLTNMEYTYFGKAIDITNKGPYGNGIISKYPLYDIERIIVPDPIVKDEDAYYETRVLLKLKTKINNEVINIMVIHVGLAKSEQNNAMELILSEINKTSGKLILMGDFNMEPTNPHIKKLQTILNDTGLLFNNKFTFPSINAIKQIDYIFTRNLNVISADVNELVGSDHYPVSCIIDINE